MLDASSDAHSTGGAANGLDRRHLDELLARISRRCGTPRSTRAKGGDGAADGGNPRTETLVREILEASARVLAASPGGQGSATATEDLLAEAVALMVGMVRDAAAHLVDSTRRERWAVATTTASTRLFHGGDQRPLDDLAHHAAEAAEADFGSLTLLAGAGQLRVHTATGSLATSLAAGSCPDPATSLAGRVVRTGRPTLAEEYPEADATGPVVMVPLGWGDNLIGTLAVGRAPGGRPFTAVDVRHLVAFAAQTAGAIEYARSDAGHKEVRRRDEVSAQATELTDQVVGDLFAVGLGLQQMVVAGALPAHRERLTDYVESLTSATARIRAFFVAEFPRRRHPVLLSLRLLATVDAAELAIGTPIRVSFTDCLNRALPPRLADDIIELVQHALTSVAHARVVELRIDYRDDAFVVAVSDDGTATLTRSRLVAVLRATADHTRSVRQSHTDDGRNLLVWTARTH
ncbi:GAF domain-containing protein [Actinokineospora auranticolor]|uniref:GAF domain-containing protein n=1 Tax=Actinokineospora auranticolor TaxID=155976 RepID=A0A2S6GIQ5_9PSEU|nr:GAF domain-containing protein [Actinokineospora auranticolor]PPK65080.1 GAF domain-containing protein [Actinokineospora auranticolor]